MGCTVLENVFKSYSVDSSTLNESIDLFASTYPSMFILLFSFIIRLFVNRLLAADSNKVCLHVHPLSLPYTIAVYEESVHYLPLFSLNLKLNLDPMTFLLPIIFLLFSLIFSPIQLFSPIFFLFSLISSYIFRLCSWC